MKPHLPRRAERRGLRLWHVWLVLPLAFIAAITIAASIFYAGWDLLGARELKPEHSIDSKTLFDLVKLSFGVVAGASALIALVLCAYLQLPFTPDPGDDPAHQEEHHRYLALRKVWHTILRLIGDHYRRPRRTHGSWQGCNLDLTEVNIDGDMDFRGATFSGGTVHFDLATCTDGAVDFSLATFTGGTVNFDRTTGPAPLGLLAAVGPSAGMPVILPSTWAISYPWGLNRVDYAPTSRSNRRAIPSCGNAAPIPSDPVRPSAFSRACG